MTLYDSSVLIDYLAGNAAAVEYVEERLDARAVTVPLVLYEVYQGEIFKSGPADFDAVDRALEWLSVVDETADLARTAAELQGTLQRGGDVLTVRDAFIAGAAKGLGDTLAVSDSDFDAPGVTDGIDIEFV